MPTEEWRDVPGYEGLYQVSNKGRVQKAWKCATTPETSTTTQLRMFDTIHEAAT